jgi:hypothetical protein
MYDQISPGICQTDAVATIDYPAPIDGDRDSLFLYLVEVDRQYPPTMLANRRIQCLHQEAGELFALLGHYANRFVRLLAPGAPTGFKSPRRDGSKRI